MSKIIISVVCYQNENEIVTFAKGLELQEGHNLILLVTCNKVNDYQKLEKQLQNLKIESYIYNSYKNLGYLPGCLYGICEYINNGKCYDWAMISNTDITFARNDFFNIINGRDGDVWGVGSDIVLSTSRRHQNPFLLARPSRKKIKLWKAIYSRYITFRLYFKAYEIKTKLYSEYNNKKLINGYIYALHGSCFLLRKQCVGELLTFKNAIFMYGEELLVAEVVHNNKKHLVLDTSYQIFHNENQVTGSIPSRRKQKWFRNSINILDKTFYSQE